MSFLERLTQHSVPTSFSIKLSAIIAQNCSFIVLNLQLSDLNIIKINFYKI